MIVKFTQVAQFNTTFNATQKDSAEFNVLDHEYSVSHAIDHLKDLFDTLNNDPTGDDKAALALAHLIDENLKDIQSTPQQERDTLFSKLQTKAKNLAGVNDEATALDIFRLSLGCLDIAAASDANILENTSAGRSFKNLLANKKPITSAYVCHLTPASTNPMAAIKADFDKATSPKGCFDCF